MDGYADRAGPSAGTLDALELNACVLSDGTSEPFAWVTLDGIAVTPPLRDALAAAVHDAAGVPPDRVVVVASHTHSGPSGWAGEIHPVLPALLDPDAVARLRDAAHCALAAAPTHSVELRYSQETVVGGGANRHRVDGPHDTSTGVLTALAVSGPVAVVFDYACHPTVLGPDNLRWSSDWVGPARAAIRAAVPAGVGAAAGVVASGPAAPGPVPVLLLQGAAGDVSPRFVRRGRDAGEASRLGSLIGAVAAALIGRGSVLPPSLRFSRDAVNLRVRDDEDSGPNSPDDAATGRLAESRAEGVRSREALRAAAARAGFDRLSHRHATSDGEAGFDGLSHGDSREVPVSLLELGGRRWLHVGAEVFTSLAAEWSAGDDALRVIGYADGYAGYLADAAAHAAGEYEASASFFDLAETKRFVDAVRAWLTATPRP